MTTVEPTTKGSGVALTASPRVNLTMRVNDHRVELNVATYQTLVRVLREELELTGTKIGCDQGACGACTVLLDGRRVLSCLTLAAQCDGREVTTIEGLGSGNSLHLLQKAFIERDAPRWKPRIERLFIAGRDVAVRATAEPDGAVVARVSNALVQEAVGTPTHPGEPGSACPDWTPLLDADHRLAWVCTNATRPVSGLYYAFARVGGAWKLTRIYSLAE